MQEKTVPVFVLATANNIEHLPPERLRKGRFDDIFFIDLPDSKETVPLSVTYKEHIDELRAWAEKRARPAT